MCNGFCDCRHPCGTATREPRPGAPRTEAGAAAHCTRLTASPWGLTPKNAKSTDALSGSIVKSMGCSGKALVLRGPRLHCTSACWWHLAERE